MSRLTWSSRYETGLGEAVQWRTGIGAQPTPRRYEWLARREGERRGWRGCPDRQRTLNAEIRESCTHLQLHWPTKRNAAGAVGLIRTVVSRHRGDQNAISRCSEFY